MFLGEIPATLKLQPMDDSQNDSIYMFYLFIYLFIYLFTTKYK